MHLLVRLIYVTFLCFLLLGCASEERRSVQQLSGTQKDFEEGPFQTRDSEYLRILFAGDTHFAWRIGKLQEHHGNNFPVRQLSRLFSRADYRILNLETAIATKNEPLPTKAYIFSASPDKLKLLHFLAVDGVVLGNNHSMDLGKGGLEETLSNLRKAGIAAIGAGKNSKEAHSPLLVQLDGIKVAFFSYSMVGESMIFAKKDRAGVHRFLIRDFRKQVKAIRKQADVVILSLHWGVEYYTRPLPSQISLAHKAVEAGADAVIGHHPHIPFGLEIYKNSIIAYSMGNFLFGSVNERQDHNFVIRLDIDRKTKRLHSVRIFPVFGKYREDTEETIRPLSPTESRLFWKQLLVQTRQLSPATAERIEVNQLGEGRILIQKTP